MPDSLDAQGLAQPEEERHRTPDDVQIIEDDRGRRLMVGKGTASRIASPWRCVVIIKLLGRGFHLGTFWGSVGYSRPLLDCATLEVTV
ncbi:hypothetical protein Scep_009641 [Stephania cephalantha]|uniref:Uncharacterized protein n=1 Tax=Stephania cephalantha TaxID=152367 RepID=A0AAP0PGD5_9MAGN